MDITTDHALRTNCSFSRFFRAVTDVECIFVLLLFTLQCAILFIMLLKYLLCITSEQKRINDFGA